ncbi:MAG: DUF6236 family protein [Candidatus Methanospirare jalkutatii]|nr:DUF6236 family protein [Candidatus Methanospirare jalkutatii]
MERKIIYYPTIIVPSEWAKWAVLYFDKVSSIIPKGVDYREVVNPWNEKDFKIMKILMKEGEFEPTDPQHLLSQREKWANREMLIKEFKKIITSSKFQSIINKNWKRRPIWKVHRDKVSNGIYEFLHEQGLAEVDKKSPNWILMEKKTNLLYMSLLAKYLADVNPDFTVPGTDSSEYEKIIYGAFSRRNSFISLDAKFMNVLPVPAPDVPITNILKFKEKRRYELLNFREVIDRIYQDISMAENEGEIKQIVLSYREKIEMEVTKLRKMMKEEYIKTVFGTFKSLLDIKSPDLLTTLGVSLSGLPLKVKIPILGTIVTIQIGYYLVDKINEQRAKLRKSPFAYLYCAEKAGII